MKSNLFLLFFMKRPKNYSEGTIPIYIRLTLDSKRSEFATGIKCEPDKWCAKTGRALGKTELLRSINNKLHEFEMKLIKIHQLLIDTNDHITVEMIKDVVMGKNNGTAKMIVEVFIDHNNKVEMLVGKDYRKATYQRYETTRKHFVAFLKAKYKIPDLPVGKVTYHLISEFEFYLRSVRGCANNSAVKYVKNFKKIINICLASGWLDKDPFLNYKSKLKTVDRAFLNNDDIEKLTNKVFSIERLSAVRDIFLFSCYTGLAYADVQKLNISEIEKRGDGKLWITTKRRKTDTAVNVPLLPMAKYLMDKYYHHPIRTTLGMVFPVSSNQKMNAYLKEIAELCGINKELTYHIARHTFATTITLSNGVPIESVSKMLGHTNIKTTQHYAKILDSKVGHDMEMLIERLKI